MKLMRASAALIVDAVAVGLSLGFYAWMLSGPRPADVTITQTPQKHLLTGLPPRLLLALAAGSAIAFVLNRSPATRAWRSRLSLALCGLYLAATAVAAGPAALFLAPICALSWLVALHIRRDAHQSGGLLAVLHAGTFGTALAFFHQWAWYRAGWDPFVQNLAALGKLWLGR